MYAILSCCTTGSLFENLEKAAATGTWDWCLSHHDCRQSSYGHHGDRRRTPASWMMPLQCTSENSFSYTADALPAQLLSTYFSQGDAGDQRLSPVACTLHTTSCLYWTCSGNPALMSPDFGCPQKPHLSSTNTVPASHSNARPFKKARCLFLLTQNL